jgi:hypothetical protein
MGLGRTFLLDLIELKRSGALDRARTIIEIGDQQISDDFILAPELGDLCRLFQCEKPQFLRPVGKENFANLAPSPAPFWRTLGFDRQAIDVRGDAIRIDLNHETVPSSLRNKFDLLLNLGTSEHVANQGNAFQIMHDLVHAGSIMYHEVPAGGLIDHGFVAYQPKFFHRLCRENNYELLFLKLIAWGISDLPVQYHRSRSQNSVTDCSLNVAIRKRHNSPFSYPLD